MAEKAPWEQDEIAPWETTAPKTPDQSQFNVSMESLGRGALESLPILGSIAGGIVGTGAGPVGTVAGSALGAVGGKALQQTGEALFFGEGPKTREEQFKELGTEAVYGGLGEIGGQLIGKGISKAVSKVPEVAEWTAKKTGKIVANIPEQYTGEYLAKKGQIQAPERTKILDDLVDLYNTSQSKVEQAATKQTVAKDELSNLKDSIQNQWKDKKYFVKSELTNASEKFKEKALQIKNDLNKDIVTPLTDSVVDSMESLKSDLSKLSGESYAILEKDPNAYSVRQAGRVLREMASELNIQPFEKSGVGIAGQIQKGQPLTAETRALQSKILDLAQRFEATPERLPAKELKKIIQQLDQSAQANYNSLEFDSRVSQAYKLARGVIDDAIKKANPLYASKMAELAPKTELYSQALEKLGRPEKIISRLQGIASKPGQMVDLGIIDQLGQATGKDFKTPLSQYIENQRILKSPGELNKVMGATVEAQNLLDLENAWKTLQNPETERALWQSPAWLDAEAKAGKSLEELQKAQESAALFKGFSPMQVESKVKALTGARQYGPSGLFEKVQTETGRDFAQEIRNRELLDQFLKADTQGSRKTVAGSVIGGGLGGAIAGPPGAALGGGIGSVTGMALDRYGGQVFKKGLDIGIKGGEIAAPWFQSLEPQQKQLYKGLIQKYFESPSGQMKEAPPEKPKPSTGAILEKLKGSRYESLLQNALKNGGEQSFAAANYVLKNRDQDYRKLFDETEV